MLLISPGHCSTVSVDEAQAGLPAAALDAFHYERDALLDRQSGRRRPHVCPNPARRDQQKGARVAGMAAREALSNSIESGPRIGVQKVPLLAGRNDSARPRRSWS
ncbi:MAG: hypothetical protein WA624_06135, partial [Methylocella sp.]